MSGLGDEDLQARVHRALASVSRVRILQLLEAAPRDVAGIATLTGLHANTVRSHLGVLERADLVCRMTTDATGPGRPPVRYRLAPPPPEAKMGGGLETLTEVLIASLLGVADDLARRYGEVVCAAHLGLVRGALEELGARVRADLVPWVEPTMCLVDLSPGPPA
jgi:predicted ArsR family transcriptional regulator